MNTTLPALAAGFAIAVIAACAGGTTGNIEPEKNLKVDSLKQFAEGLYEMSLAGYKMNGTKPETCDTCSGFRRILALNSDFSFEDSTVDMGTMHTITKNEGTWTFINDSVVTLNNGSLQTLLLIERPNEQLRVVHYNGVRLEEQESQQLVYKKYLPNKTAFNMAEKLKNPYFKAIGTEPFWTAELYTGERNILRYIPMEGDTEYVEFPMHTTATNGGITYKYSDKDNTNHLIITNEKCSDGMSEKVYWYKAEIKLGNRILSGAGEFADGRSGLSDEQKPDKKVKTIDGKWMLETVENKKWQSPKTVVLDINSKEKRYSGNNGCNQIFGECELNANKSLIELKAGGSTKMACIDYPENQYMKLLVGKHSYRTNDKNTELFLRKDGKELKFVKQ